ncbi:hypothetical protein [Mycobacterium riyadhense]|uniref:Uncharacterized protein n=1 Tax=Mycobacterium riyadhense TaxID=486698 RepID=A0A653ERG6_9MYCO|nr:hypothetical protein BIN_B_03270 [Mycobacterium riyadhense]
MTILLEKPHIDVRKVIAEALESASPSTAARGVFFLLSSDLELAR